MLKRILSLPLLLTLALVACRSSGPPKAAPAPAPPGSVPDPVLPEAQPEPGPELQEIIPAWEAKGVRTAYSRAGTYLLKWRPVEGVVPKNKHFEIDLWLFKAGEELLPFGGAVIATRGWMPEHGHGMVRQPRSQQLEVGHYRISGMLLHMGGYWQIFFDVVVDSVAESTQFDLTL